MIVLPKTANPDHMKSNADVEFVISDEEVTKYLSWSPHGTVDVTKEILKQWVCNSKIR